MEKEEVSIRSLSGVSLDVITNAFNQAFADYLVPMHITVAQLQLKMKQEQIDLEWSAGAFAGDELIGFVLHGNRNSSGNKLLYNAGTGVMPAWRGRQLTERMYGWVTHRAVAAGFHSISLEVITGNEKALHIYANIGFRKQRTFNIWKGKTPEASCKKPLQFDLASTLPRAAVQQWWRVQPCWSAAPASIEALQDQVWILTAQLANQLVGYCCLAAYNGRLLQLAVAPAHRKKGIASALLAEASRRWNKTEWMVLNVDAADQQVNSFFANMHWQLLLQQYEMTLSLQAS